MSEPGLDCQGMRAHTCAFLGDQLSDELRSAVEAHLAACQACRDLLEVARRTSCKHVADFLSDYIEGELPEDERVVFEGHLQMCPPCVDYMRSLETTIRAGHELCGDDCPPIPDELVRAILESRRRC